MILVRKVIIQNSIVLSTQLKLSVGGKRLPKTTTTYANTLRFSSWQLVQVNQITNELPLNLTSLKVVEWSMIQIHYTKTDHYVRSCSFNGEHQHVDHIVYMTHAWPFGPCVPRPCLYMLGSSSLTHVFLHV
jgi:hypothetical protein